MSLFPQMLLVRSEKDVLCPLGGRARSHEMRCKEPLEATFPGLRFVPQITGSSPGG